MKKKYIIVNQKPDISHEIIKQRMDFASVYTLYQKSTPGLLTILKNAFRKWSAMSIAIVTIGVGIYILLNTHENDILPTEKTDRNATAYEYPEEEFILDQKAQKNFNIGIQKIEVPITKEKTKPDVSNSENHSLIVKSNDTTSTELNDNKSIAEAELSEPFLKEDVYHPPSPKDGFPALYQYYAENMKYPESAIKDSIAGKVLVKFMISHTGDISRISIKESLGSDFDKEAIRLVENMPKWSPATLNGKPIDTYMAIPLVFEFHIVKGGDEK